MLLTKPKKFVEWIVGLLTLKDNKFDNLRLLTRSAALFWFIGLLGIGLYLIGRESWLSLFGSAVTAAACSFTVGCSIGFLFGVPKSTQQNNQPSGEPVGGDAQDRHRTVQPNSNLEQVSDWLTKILVGVGLTQFASIVEYLQKIDKLLGDAMEAKPGISIALVIHFFVSGFLVTFLITRIHLQRAIARADLETDPSWILSAERARQIDVDPDADKPKLDPIDKEAVDNVLQASLNDLMSVEGILAWANAQMVKRRFVEAIKAYKRALLLRPGDPQIQKKLANALIQDGQNREANNLLESVFHQEQKQSVEERKKTIEKMMLSALYDDPPYGFKKAIDYIKRYENEYGESFSPRGWMYVAAANGQRHAYAVENKLDQAEIDDARNTTLNATKKALATGDPFVKRMLRTLWDPNVGSPDEDDLYSLHEDSEFEMLFK
jgi:tetratricopeptide (TPR) repeat protein